MPSFTEQDAAAIRGLTDAHLEAVLDHDPDAFLATCSGDIVFLPPEQPPLEGQSACRAFLCTVLAGAIGFATTPAVAWGQDVRAGSWPISVVHLADSAVTPSKAGRGFRLETEVPSLWTEWPQVAPPSHRRTGTGFALGVTLSALVASTVFNGNFCTGSGDYLSFCRAFYAGSVATGAGLGALLGLATRRSEPPGRSLTLLRGAAVGTLGVFALSLPFCANYYEKKNPGVLCSREGMPTAGHTAAFAAGGALIANVLTRNSARSDLAFGVAPSLDGSVSLIGRVRWR